MLRYLAFFPFLFLACNAEELAEENQQEPFFDLAGYIDRQVDSLNEVRPTVTKTIVLNGQREEQQRQDVDFAADLRVLRDSDINRPAWLDKYTVEQSTTGGRRSEVYSALDSSLQTRELRIMYRDGKPEEITVFRRTGTVLSDGDHYLSYRPDRGYTLRSEQVNRFGDDLNADIRVSWE
jgi:hypothetical protein